MRAVGEGQVPSGVRAADVERVGVERRPRGPGSPRRWTPSPGRPPRYARCRARYRGWRSGRRRPRQARAAATPRSRRVSGRGRRLPARARRGRRAGAAGVGDHALGGLDAAEHQDGRVGDGLGLGERPGHLREQRRPAGARSPRRRLAASSAKARSRRPADGLAWRGTGEGGLAASCGRRGLGLDCGHDPVVPAEDLRRIGRAQTEGLGHDGGRQRPGHGAAELSLTAGLDGRHQPAGLGPGERGEPGVDLLGPEGPGERRPVAGVLRAIQREHARAHHLGRGEPGVVDRERPCITQHVDG